MQDGCINLSCNLYRNRREFLLAQKFKSYIGNKSVDTWFVYSQPVEYCIECYETVVHYFNWRVIFYYCESFIEFEYNFSVTQHLDLTFQKFCNKYRDISYGKLNVSFCVRVYPQFRIVYTQTRTPHTMLPLCKVQNKKIPETNPLTWNKININPVTLEYILHLLRNIHLKIQLK